MRRGVLIKMCSGHSLDTACCFVYVSFAACGTIFFEIPHRSLCGNSHEAKRNRQFVFRAVQNFSGHLQMADLLDVVYNRSTPMRKTLDHEVLKTN